MNRPEVLTKISGRSCYNNPLMKVGVIMKRNEKKAVDIKNILFWIVGGLASFVPVLGEYPIALAFFAAAYTQNVWRLALTLVFFCGAAFSGTTLQIAKYYIIGLTFIGIWKLAEYKGRVVKPWLAGLLMGGLFIIMNISKTLYSFGDTMKPGFFILEGIFIATLSIVFQTLAEPGRQSMRKNFSENGRKEQKHTEAGYGEAAELEEYLRDPGKARLIEGAKALNRLSKAFSSIQNYQERLSHEEMERMFHQLENGVCQGCAKARQCWVVNSYRTCLATEELFYVAATQEGVSEGDGKEGKESETTVLQEELVFLKNCLRRDAYYQAVRDLQEKAKLTLLWQNQQTESRMAVAGQLKEMSRFLSGMAEEVYGREAIEESLERRIYKGLESRQLEVAECKGSYLPNGILEIFLFLRSRRGQAVSVREVEKEVSRISGRKMLALRDGRRIVNSKTVALTIREEPVYSYLHGVARAAKNKESISGDNFTLTLGDNGTILMGLSDGMGSGFQAGKDSEMIMDLIEQFFEAGFHMETAVNLINATCLVRGEEPMGATVDLCLVNLHEGTYQFLKQGAVSSFILEQGQVKRIQGHSMPIGLYAQDSFSLANGQLGKEAYLIMVSDGILDAFRQEDGEQALEEILLYEEQKNPRAMANKILEEALAASNERPRDDMTALVLGLWRS